MRTEEEKRKERVKGKEGRNPSSFKGGVNGMGREFGGEPSVLDSVNMNTLAAGLQIQEKRKTITIKYGHTQKKRRVMAPEKNLSQVVRRKDQGAGT